MTFRPSRCPNPACGGATAPGRRPFFRCKGSFSRPGDRRVRRFQCRTCRRHFSEQTFREDYRQKRPELDVPLRRLMRLGYSIRAASRVLALDRKTVARRYRRLRRHELTGRAQGPPPP